MLDRLGCGPDDLLHCSSSFRYDLMTAYDMGIGMRAFVHRGQEPLHACCEVHESATLFGLPRLLGL